MRKQSKSGNIVFFNFKLYCKVSKLKINGIDRNAFHRRIVWRVTFDKETQNTRGGEEGGGDRHLMVLGKLSNKNEIRPLSSTIIKLNSK